MRYAQRYGAPSVPIPTEETEQQALFEWAALVSGQFPAIRLLYHIPNGGKRGKAEAGRFKAAGVKPGVPDICLPVACGGYHGLYIELKRRHGSRTSTEQCYWIAELKNQGYYTDICYGWNEAAVLIARYLKNEV